MADPQPRPQAVKIQKAGEQVITYAFHVDIQVKTAVVDEKRLSQLIDDRIRRLASTLQNRAR